MASLLLRKIEGMQRAAFQDTNQRSYAAHKGQPWEEIPFTYLEFLLSNGYVGDSMGRDIRFWLALHRRGNSELEIQIPTHLEEKLLEGYQLA